VERELIGDDMAEKVVRPEGIVVGKGLLGAGQEGDGKGEAVRQQSTGGWNEEGGEGNLT